MRGCGAAMGCDEEKDGDADVVDDVAVLAPSCAAARRCAIAGGGVARAAALCRNDEEEMAGGKEGFMWFGVGQRLP